MKGLQIESKLNTMGYTPDKLEIEFERTYAEYKFDKLINEALFMKSN